MAQSASDKNNGFKSKITQDIPTQACPQKRQNNLRGSRLQSLVTRRLETSFRSCVHRGSRDINQSSSVQEPTSQGNLERPCCNIIGENRGVTPKYELSYKNASSQIDSSVGTDEQEPRGFSGQQNLEIAVAGVKVEDQLAYRDDCLLGNERFCDNQTEKGQLVNYQLLNKNVSSKNRVENDSPKHEIITKYYEQNTRCCPSSSLHKNVCDIKSLISKNGPKRDRGNQHHAKLQRNTFGLSTSVPISCILNTVSLKTSDSEKGTTEQSTSHTRSVVGWEKPSESKLLKPREDALWTVKQKIASVQCFNNQKGDQSDVEISDNCMNCKSELRLSEENMPSLATQLMQKQLGAESHKMEIQREGKRVREIQQMLQLEKYSNINEEQTHCCQNVNKGLQIKYTLMKQEKPYRQWHRISRIVASESRFIISHQMSSDVCSVPNKKANRSEPALKSTESEASSEIENQSIRNVEPCVQNTNVCTDSLISKIQDRPCVKSNIGNSNCATNKLKRIIDNGNNIEQLKSAEIKEDVSTFNVAGKEVPGRLHSYININTEFVDGNNPDYYHIDDSDLDEMSHQDNALTVKNNELANNCVDNKHRGITFTGSKDFHIKYVNTKQNHTHKPNTTFKTPKIWKSVDTYKMDTSLSKTFKHQMSSAKIPPGILFSSRARSKSLKSFCLTKRHNKRKHPKQIMVEKYRMRDHSADCVYRRGDITGCIKPRNSVSRVSQVTGPSISRKKRCNDYADYLKVTPSIVQVCEIRSEQKPGNVGKTSGSIQKMVNSDSASNNWTTVASNQRPGSVHRRSENPETCTPKYSSFSKTSSHSDRRRAGQNNCQQSRSVCKTKCSTKLQGPGKRLEQKYSRLPGSKSNQMVLSDTARTLSPHVNRKHVRSHWSQLGETCKDIQAVAYCKGMSPKLLNCQRTKRHSHINDCSEDMAYACPNTCRLKTKKRGMFSSSTSADQHWKSVKKSFSETIKR